MKVAYSLKKNRCKYLCLCKGNAKNDDFFQVLNLLGFTIIFSKGRDYFLTGKQNEPFKIMWQLNEHKNVKSYREWDNVQQFVLSLYAKSLGGAISWHQSFFCLGNKERHRQLQDSSWKITYLIQNWRITSPPMNIKEAISFE